MDEMKTILTVNGKQYSVQAPPGWVLGPADIEQAKQNILSGNIKTMNPATCLDVMQGTAHDITLTATGGVPNYTYRLLLDGTQIATAGPTANTSNIFNYTFNQAVGAHTLSGEITDSCATPQTSSDQCATFNILAATGSISCTTTPSGASVTLDGTLQPGVVTPVTLTGVPVGDHTVTFTLADYNACPVPVSVTAGSIATASCALTPVIAIVSIEPSTQTAISGTTFYIDVTIDPLGIAIAGYQFNLAFNSSVVTILSVTEGNLLKQGGALTYFSKGTINNIAGTLINTFCAIIGKNSVSTKGTAVRIILNANNAGSSNITLSNVKISTPAGLAVPNIVNNGTVNVLCSALGITMDIV